MTSPQALWTATIKGQTVRLTNGAKQTLTFYYNGGSSGYPTDFYASTGSESDASKQYFRFPASGDGLRLFYDGADNRDYYLISNMTNSKKFQYSTTASNGLVFRPMTKTETTITEPVTGLAYLVTNVPLERETALAVEKRWDYGNLPAGQEHERAQVTVKLLANGKETGRTVTLSLRNNFQDVFRGLPYTDEHGNVIVYTVEESWDNGEWIPSYGPVNASGASTPTYSTTITNRNVTGIGGPALPSTGTSARMLYVLCGAAIMLASLVYGMIERRKQERRME